MKKIKYIFSFICLSLMFSSCTQEMEISNEQGYLSIRVNTLESTHNPKRTRASVPTNYNAKQIHVEIRDVNGFVVRSTDDFQNENAFQDPISLEPGTYTVVAHSNGWDGNGSGFGTPYYYGSKTVEVYSNSLVTAKITCTQANVKVTVNYDDSFKTFFKSAKTTVSSSVSGITPLEFDMNETTQSGYFPVGTLTAKLDVVNLKNVSNSMTQTFENIQARDHYILNYKIKEEGFLGDEAEPGIKVEVDETTNTYTYTFEVPTKSAIALVARAANPWSTFAYLNGEISAKTQDFKNTGVTLEWRKTGAENWNVINNSALTINDKDEISAKIKGLAPETKYEYRMRYVDQDEEVFSEPATFTTEKQTVLYNGGFEDWHQSGKPWYPNEEGVKFWDTSNPGSTAISASYNVTTRTDSPKRNGSYAAKLESKKVVIAFAAASMYTGQFLSVNTSTKVATLNWGTPFETRPTALKGFMQYSPQPVDNVGKNLPASAPAKGEPDQCGIYCALLTESLIVDNEDMSKFPDWENDPRVIAYGTLPTEKSGKTTDGQWTEVNIPLIYHDLTKKPTHLLIVFSASKYGDYFHGGKGSTLYLDDFELVYGDEPAVK